MIEITLSLETSSIKFTEPKQKQILQYIVNHFASFQIFVTKSFILFILPLDFSTTHDIVPMWAGRVRNQIYVSLFVDIRLVFYLQLQHYQR